jgi:DNA-binding beta-propeller fold protein YncE
MITAKPAPVLGLLVAVVAALPAAAAAATASPGPKAERPGTAGRPLVAEPGLGGGVLVVGSVVPPASEDAVTGVVTVIDTLNNSVIRAVKIDALPTALAVAPSGRTVYVAGAGSDVLGSPGTFRSINASSGAVGKVAKVGRAPVGLALSGNGQTAYVVCGFDAATQKPAGSVWPVNTASGGTGAPVTVTPAPTAVAFAPGGRAGFVLGQNAISLVHASGGRVARVVDVDLQATAIAIRPNGQAAYVIGHAPGSFIEVVPVSAATGARGKAVATGASVPADLAISPNGKTVFVVGTPDPGLGATEDTVTEISTTADRVTKTVNLGVYPNTNEWAIAVDPNGTEAYVLGYGSTKTLGRVIPFDTATGTVGKAILVGDNAGAITFASNGKWAYVLDQGAENGASSSHGQVVPINVASGSAGKPLPISGYAEEMAAS